MQWRRLGQGFRGERRGQNSRESEEVESPGGGDCFQRRQETWRKLPETWLGGWRWQVHLLGRALPPPSREGRAFVPTLWISKLRPSHS